MTGFDPDWSSGDVDVLMRAEYEAACAEAQPPAAGLVWWRAERRLRLERTRAATRPLTVVHAISGACAIGVAAALLQFLAPWLRQWISAAVSLAGVLDFVRAVSAPYASVVALVALAWLVVAPFAVYVALSDD